jgi:UPF0755 protein
MSEMSLSEVLPGAFPPDDEPPRRRGAARRRQKQKKRRRRRAFVVILLTVAIVGGGLAGSYVLGLAPLIQRLTAPKDYEGAGTGTVQVKIPTGASGRTIARALVDAGVVKTQSAFLDAAAKDDRSVSIQPGTYELRRQMSASVALTALLDPKAQLRRTVTIPEGTRAADAFTVIAKQLKLKKSDLRKAAESGDIGLPKAAKGQLEGFLYPATYDFEPDVTAKSALSAMVERGQQVYDELEIPPSKLREVVIKASIVQAEAGNKQSMGKVARVLDNRLDDGLGNGGLLQLDSTVSYATGKFGITTTRADRQSSSRYNTYRYPGLPKGPISNPGEDALKAVLDPTPGDWLFFVTTNPDTGETKFADNVTDHNKNVLEFQAWLRTHKR